MKLYEKTVDGKYFCMPISKIVITKDNMQIFNPNENDLLEDGWIEHIITADDNSKQDILNEIEALKIELENSDYKIIKCMEAYMCKETMPYNIEDLHAIRNSYRNKINDLEQYIL